MLADVVKTLDDYRMARHRRCPRLRRWWQRSENARGRRSRMPIPTRRAPTKGRADHARNDRRRTSGRLRGISDADRVAPGIHADVFHDVRHPCRCPAPELPGLQYWKPCAAGQAPGATARLAIDSTSQRRGIPRYAYRATMARNAVGNQFIGQNSTSTRSSEPATHFQQVIADARRCKNPRLRIVPEVIALPVRCYLNCNLSSGRRAEGRLSADRTSWTRAEEGCGLRAYHWRRSNAAGVGGLTIDYRRRVAETQPISESSSRKLGARASRARLEGKSDYMAFAHPDASSPLEEARRRGLAPQTLSWSRAPQPLLQCRLHDPSTSC